MTISRMTYASVEKARIEFAEKAAAHFAANPKHWGYGNIAPGELIALRWGMGDDCVLVLKLDADEEPVNFQALVRAFMPEAIPAAAAGVHA